MPSGAYSAPSNVRLPVKSIEESVQLIGSIDVPVYNLTAGLVNSDGVLASRPPCCPSAAASAHASSYRIRLLSFSDIH